MKSIIKFSLLLFSFSSFSLFAQNGINYKAVIKDNLGNVVANQSVTIQFSILKGVAQTNEYTETHNPTTDANGIVIVNIGEGTPVSGAYSSITWGSDEHHLNVQVDIGSGLVDMGTTEFKAVPYALNVTGLEALDEGNGIGWRLKGKNPLYYGNLGNFAVDLSHTGNVSSNGATGDFSTALGVLTTASGNSSTAFGVSTLASGTNSTALGSGSLASGTGSLAANSSSASGDYSASFGLSTKSESQFSIATGFNNIGGGSANSWILTDPLFEIGNGFGAPSNALTVLKNGTVTAPSFDISEIVDDKALITKEYADANLLDSGLEALDEGNGVGWRLKGKDPSHYGNVGFGAIDLSYADVGAGTFGATGGFAFTGGYYSTASGTYATALGYNTEATAIGSSAFGDSTNATGITSTAFGANSIASGDYSLATGSGTTASGDYSTAMGVLTVSSGQSSTAMGFLSEAIGLYSIAAGNDNTADGDAAIALGNNNNATAHFSVAIGLDNTASGFASTALGGDTSATAAYATAFGNNTIASGNSSTALGKFNINNSNALLSLGYGTDDANRANALTVLQNGNVGISRSDPQVRLQVVSGIDAALTNGTGYFLIGFQNGQNIVMDNNEIMARDNGATSTLFLQQDGGNVAVNGAVVHTSDKRLKKDIESLSYGLKEVLALNPVTYKWKDKPHQKHKSLGLIAQELQQVISELVTTESDEQKTLHVNYTELIPVLIKAIQEQQKIIDNQDSKIRGLSTELETLNSLKDRVEQIESMLKHTNN